MRGYRLGEAPKCIRPVGTKNRQLRRYEYRGLVLLVCADG